MTDSPKLSRRDWFRLRTNAPSDQPTQATRTRATGTEPNSMGETQNGLQSIALPENHDGLDLSTLPPMREALLSPDQVRQLFADIEQLATDVLLMQRASSRGARATASKATSAAELSTAKEAVLSGSVTRLQIRYRWQDAAWIDTLEFRPDGFRLVRISHAGM